MSHLKRYAMPDFWPLPRKENIWVVRPIPGPHSIKGSIPLQVLLRDVLKYADNAKEAKTILNNGSVLVDKKVRKELKYPVGLMDVVEIPEMKKYFTIIAGKRGLSPREITAEEAETKLCKILNKVPVKKDMFQLNLHDGRNVLIKEGDYKPGDSLLIHIPDQKILGHFKLGKGSNALIFGGKNMGVKGKINKIKQRKNMLETSTVTLISDGKEIVTQKNYIFILSDVSKTTSKSKVETK